MKYTWITTLKNVSDQDLKELSKYDIIPIYKDANVHAHKLPNTEIPTYEFINIKKH